MSPRLWAASVALLLSVGCGQPQEPESTPAPQLGPVVQSRLAELDRELGTSDPLPELTPAQLQDLDGLVTMLVSSTGALRQVPLEAINEDIGPAAVPRLREWLVDDAREAAQRLAAAELLAALDHPLAAEALLRRVELAPEAWMRSWCAWYLGNTSQDQVLPRLLLRLRYEKDPPTYLWLGRALLHFNNYAGLAALEDLAERAANQPEVNTAAQLLQDAAARAGVERSQLRALWSSQRATELPQLSPSLLLRREVWRLVSELSEQHFQLRGVDDARHVLANMGPWVAMEITPALADSDAHIRLHTAQVLERMGPRASRTGQALLRALGDPRLAPAAAEALGRIGYPPAVPVLAAKSERGQQHELRVAALRALGRTGVSEGLASLRAAFQPNEEPADLCQAAATGLVLLGAGDQAATWLVQQLSDPLADGQGAELAIETWLWRGAQSERGDFAVALEGWRALAEPPGIFPSLEQVRQRLDQRARLLGSLLPKLLASPQR